MPSSFRDLVDEVERKRGYVYLIRNGNLHKIGVTMDLERRMKELRPDEIIAVYQANNVTGVEKLLHSRYKNVRLPQTEYFRLSQEQVREVKLILNGKEGLEAEPVHKWIKEIEERRLEIFDAIGLLFDGADSDNILWSEHEDSKGRTQTVLHWLLNDPDSTKRLPASQATLNAAERMLVKDDAIAPIAKASCLEELEIACIRFIDDFSLLYCWLWDSNILKPQKDNQGMFNSLSYMKQRLVANGLRWSEN
jgi:hypothetical protein